MKRWFVPATFFCIASAAYANPIILDPIGTISYTLVLGSAFLIEAAIVTLILLFWGIAAKPAWLALILGNLAIYFFIFRPLLANVPNLWIAEAVIVLLDALLIKGLTMRDTFCDTDSIPLKMRYALAIALVGNIASYYIGAATA